MSDYYGVTLENKEDKFVQESINNYFGTDYGTVDFVDLLYALDEVAGGYCLIDENEKYFKKYLMRKWSLEADYHEDAYFYNEEGFEKSSNRYEFFQCVQKTIQHYYHTKEFTTVHLLNLRDEKPHLFI